MLSLDDANIINDALASDGYWVRGDVIALNALDKPKCPSEFKAMIILHAAREPAFLLAMKEYLNGDFGVDDMVKAFDAAEQTSIVGERFVTSSSRFWCHPRVLKDHWLTEEMPVPGSK